jgi:hypothetical protein
VNLKIDPDWQSISEIRIRDSTIDVIQTQDAIDAVRWNTGEVHRSSGRAGGPADLGASDRRPLCRFEKRLAGESGYQHGTELRRKRLKGGINMKRFALSFVVAVLICSAMSAQADETKYEFRTINFPTDNFTQLLGINDHDKIAGYHGAVTNKGFVLTLPDTFTPENFPGSDQTQVIGINNKGDTDGFYITAGVTHGFLDIGGFFSTVDFPGTTFNQLLGLNNRHQAAGYFADGGGIDRPYIFAIIGKVFSEIFIPGAALNGAQATGINDRGVISGFFIDNGGATHGFLLDQGTLIQLDVLGSTMTQAFGLNNKGQVVGIFVDGAGMHGFVFEHGHFVTIDDPNGIGTTTVNGINDRGQLVGFYVDGAGNTDGFLATPKED